ncbi:unnamed protein product [Clonostachys rosea]|uniref:Zn(2)-C6 fungal-type domain-containing protein n=1 Tax=Bionectria ochroleuca TaxID=29856 RepID=A0ABY6UHK6_BIOOC|nr:unnamed protein product [Clonostachys rosea]
MPRGGIKRLRTGCHTCKIRKVKCDEARPECKRCTRTGRKCDGFSPVLNWKTYTVSTPAAVLPPVQGVRHIEEARALHFFQLGVAPWLSGPYPASFWTHTILQIGTHEPAIRRSVVAISLLYEDFITKTSLMPQLRHNMTALRHYNAAIHELKDLTDVHLILLACLLFICIELMQGSETKALSHLEAGLRIIRATSGLRAWVREILLPLYQRQSILLLKFGRRDEVDALARPLISHKGFATLEHARAMTDELYLQIFQLTADGAEYRHGRLQHQPVHTQLIAKQNELQCVTRAFRDMVLPLERSYSLSDDHRLMYLGSLVTLELCQIGLLTAFETSEMRFDDLIRSYREIVAHMEEIGASMIRRNGGAPVQPVFQLETGYLTNILAVILKCRHLPTRLKAYSLLRQYGSTRQGLWETDKMCSICKRVIEIEHDIAWDGLELPLDTGRWNEWPQKELRVCHIIQDYKPNLDVGEGHSLYPLMLIMRDGEGRVYHLDEAVAIG